MIQHIVLLKLKAGTTDEQANQAFAQAAGLVDEIDGVQRITFGRHRGDTDHGFTHAFIATLSDDAALTGYLTHPARGRYLTEIVDPLSEERIEIDVPDDASHRHTRRGGRDWEWGATRHSASAEAAALRWEEKEGDGVP